MLGNTRRYYRRAQKAVWVRLLGHLAGGEPLTKDAITEIAQEILDPDYELKQAARILGVSPDEMFIQGDKGE